MKRRLLIQLLCCVGLFGCGRPGSPGLSPATLVFPHAYVDAANQLELDFTLNGQPLNKPKFSLSAAADSVELQIVPAAPLSNAPDKLQCTPRVEGDSTASLTVTDGGRSFVVPIRIHAVPSPACPEAQTCQQVTVDTSTGQCVTTNLPDGTTCGTSLCPNQLQLCRAGQCVTQPDPRIPAECLLDALPTQAQPVWTFPLTNQLADSAFPGVVDDAGNVYWSLVAAPGAPSVDVISLDPMGQLRWRQTLPLSDGENQRGGECSSEPGVELLLSGGELIVLSGCLTPNLQAWHLTDGSPIWSEITPLTQIVDAGGGLLVGLKREVVYEDSGGLLILDALTGEYKATFLAGASRSSLLVSDGAGDVFGLAVLDSALSVSTLAVNATSGPLWQSSAVVDNSAEPLAVNGQTLFVSTDQLLTTTAGQPIGTASNVDRLEAVVSGAGTSFDARKKIGDGCSNLIVERTDPLSGRPLWRCRMPEGDRPVQLTLTADGGLVVLGAVEGTGLLLAFDADGTVVERVPSFEYTLGATVFSGHRVWTPVIGGLAAYDLPITLAEHGWVSSAGGPAGGYSPR